MKKIVLINLIILILLIFLTEMIFRLILSYNVQGISENLLNIKKSKDILFVGGSVTFGPGIKAEKTFVELLNNQSNFNIKNASVFGTNLENNIEIIKNHNNLQNVNKVFINFPLDDIISNKVNLKKNETREKSIIDSFKKNKIVNYLNTLVRSKSAAYVFVKSVIVNPQKNNYLYDLNLKEILIYMCQVLLLN